jgi:MFS family permease
VGILSASQFAGNLGFGCVIPVLPLFASEIGLGASGVGLIVSAPALTRLLFNFPFGRAADRVGRKPLMVGGQLVTAAASVATAFSASLAPLFASRLLLGVGSSASMSGAQAYMADLSSAAGARRHRAKIMGFQSTVINTAYAIGPAVGGALCDLYGARIAFCVVGAAAGVCSLGYAQLPETLSRPGANRRAGGRSSNAPPVAARKDLDPRDGPGAPLAREPSLEPPVPSGAVRALLRRPEQQASVAMNLALFSSYATMVAILPLHATAVCGATAGQIGMLFAAGSAVSFAGAPLGGWLADRFGRVRAVVPAALLVAAGAASASIPAVDSFETLVAAVSLWGLGNSMLGPGLTAYTADISDGQARGPALALSRQAGDVAFLAAPLGLGVLAELFGCGAALQATAVGVAAGTAAFAARATDARAGPRRPR